MFCHRDDEEIFKAWERSRSNLPFTIFAFVDTGLTVAVDKPLASRVHPSFRLWALVRFSTGRSDHNAERTKNVRCFSNS